MKSNLSALSRAAILLVCAAAGVSAASAQTRLPNSQLPRVGTWPNDGNDASTQWRIPDNAVTPANLANESAVEQVLVAWAQANDAEDPVAVSNLFTTTGLFGLYYINETAEPYVQSPTGYSPSSTPTGGTAGGGCTAMGQTAIANYVRGTGRTAAYAWPVPVLSNTLLLDPFVKLSTTDSTVATAHSYVFLGPWNSTNKANQIFATFKYDASTGWKISELRLLYDLAQPTAPCEN